LRSSARERRRIEWHCERRALPISVGWPFLGGGFARGDAGFHQAAAAKTPVGAHDFLGEELFEDAFGLEFIPERVEFFFIGCVFAFEEEVVG
jgi:hypothetical protein